MSTIAFRDPDDAPSAAAGMAASGDGHRHLALRPHAREVALAGEGYCARTRTDAEGTAMPTSPWVQTNPPDADGEYLMLATYLPLTRFTAVPTFLRATQAIRKQLAATPGVLGYSLRAALPTKRFYTLSAWEEEQALSAFVREVPHRDVMVDLAPHMGATKFVRWHVAGDRLPPDWSEALRRLGDHGDTDAS